MGTRRPQCGRASQERREPAVRSLNSSRDYLDHASRLPNYGSKMGIDATRKWASEGFARPWPDEIVMDSKTKALVDSKWKALAKELGIE